MSTIPNSREDVLRNYFRAKDENRPHLLARVFSADATLEVRNRASEIAFPAFTAGRAAITDVLVRTFGQTYENVYSFYMARPASDTQTFPCDWLVIMTEKDSRNVRVGCGRYDWTFESDTVGLATNLVITIEAMLVLPPESLEPTYRWMAELEYPCSSATEVEAAAPSVEPLAQVVRYLRGR
jgi:acetone carboxylase gamma subunit